MRFKVNEIGPDAFQVSRERNGGWNSEFVGSFDECRDYIAEQARDEDHFSVIWPDGNESKYLSLVINS